MYHIYAELRDAKGLSDYRVSKDTGISQSTLSDWKSGIYTPKLDKLNKLANYFDVPLERFINAED